LGSLGGSVSTAWGINDLGQVVGSSSIMGDTVDHAFLSNGSDPMTDLALLAEVRAAGWTSLTRAYDINNVGQITGGGFINGEYHGFLLTPGPAPAPETGDAGGLDNPQAVVDLANGISGTIGGTDTVDVFSFNWLEGSEMQVRLSDPTQQLESLYLSLFLPDMSELLSGIELLPGEWKSLGYLGAGNYLLKVATSSDIDPPFTLDLLGTGTGPAIGPPLGQSVPEPSALALLVLGLMGLGAMQRKKLAA